VAEDVVIRTKAGVPVDADFENIVTRDGGFTRIYIVIDSTTGRPYTRLSDGTILALTTGSGTATGTNTGDVTLAGSYDYLTLSGQVITRGQIDLTTDVSAVLPIGSGGTNSLTALSGSSIMISNGSAVVQGAAGTTTTVLHGNAAGAPTYAAVSLTADVSGVLPVANGGTGLSSLGTANQLLGVNAAAGAQEYKTLSGTSNQITVTHGVGTITLSTPQDIATGSSPTFAGMTLNGSASLAWTNNRYFGFDFDSNYYQRVINNATNREMLFVNSSNDTRADFVWQNSQSGSASLTERMRLSDTLLTIATTVRPTALTASQAVFTDSSKNLVSNPITGSGNVVMSASPTLTGTITAANIVASGVGRFNGSNVSGSRFGVLTATDRNIIIIDNESKATLASCDTAFSTYQDMRYVAASHEFGISTTGSITTVATINSSGMNGVLGATTPAALSATTGSFSGQVSTLRTLAGKTSSDVQNWAFQGYSTAAYTNGFQATYGGVASAGIWMDSAAALNIGIDGASGTTTKIKIDASGMNGVLGATTPAAVTATTGAFSGQITLTTAGGGTLEASDQTLLLQAATQVIFRTPSPSYTEMARVTTTGFQGALGQTTPAAASVTTLSASGVATVTGTDDLQQLRVVAETGQVRLSGYTTGFTGATIQGVNAAGGAYARLTIDASQLDLNCSGSVIAAIRSTGLALNSLALSGVTTLAASGAITATLANATYITAQENNINQTTGYRILANNGTTTTAIFSSNTATGEVRLGGTATSYFASLYAGNAEQARILATASANRYITLTGSNGGNPTIGVSAGNLNLSGTITMGSYGAGIAEFSSAGVISSSTTTGTGSVVRTTSPTLVTPALGTPASGDLTNCSIETGTWTPSFTSWTFTGGSPTTTARYAKIGKMVYWSLDITPVTNMSSTAGTSYITGLPYAPGYSSEAVWSNLNTNTGVGNAPVLTSGRIHGVNLSAVTVTFNCSGSYAVA